MSLYDSCLSGDIDKVNEAIARGATYWNYGLCGACQGGHRDIVDLMIARGATNWNRGLWDACSGGHRDIVDHLIRKMLVKRVKIPSKYTEEKERIIKEIEQDRYNSEMVRELVLKFPVEWNGIRKYVI